jgi:hypothetical protein
MRQGQHPDQNTRGARKCESMSYLHNLKWSVRTIPTIVIAAGIVVVAGCTTTVTSTPAHSATQQTSPVSPQVQPTPVTGLLGAAPTSCPSSSSHLHSMTTTADFGGGFSAGVVFQGISPVWELGFGRLPGDTLHLNTNGPTPWPSTKIMWVVGPNFMNPVTLQGRDLLSGVPVWFDLHANGSSPGSPTTLATLDPSNPNRGSTQNSAGHWNIWGILLFFTQSGCYDVESSWAGGQWQAVIPVGR